MQYSQDEIASDKCSMKIYINMLTPSGCFLQETPVLEPLFNYEYCEIFQRTHFEEHLQTAASENVFIKFIHKVI